ncbi:3-mercaptopyruvate sulfurtransferase [Aplysia californica]|uniref:Sulfurtransferase n=1 Tax=Aplysia californica TaxID=6500 RepID=A0ABM0JTV0_APLCA|nr:3-mercaptopyruvate sulfurtransferase [Aplysia californica]
MQRIPRSNILVSVKQLKDLVDSTSSNHRVLDASWHLPNTGKVAKAEYLEKHIPGALFFDIDDCADKTTSLPHMIPNAKGFEQYVGALGINNNTQVIVYDNHPQFGLFIAQRVWWMFRLFGHQNVSILEGGLPKWLSEGGAVTADVPDVQKEVFSAQFDEKLVKFYENIEKNIDSGEFQLVDARPDGRFKGIAPEPREDTKPGCIPNSLNVPFMACLNVDDRTVKTNEELEALFKSSGVDLTKPLAVTCGSGISSCVVALAAYLCGKEDVALYDGSWTEWYRRAPANLKKNVPSD